MTGDRIRELNELITSVPQGAHLEGLHPLQASRIDALLSLGADESAILAMLSDRIGYLISRGHNGRCLATVVLDETSREDTAPGATAGLALAGALAQLLADDAGSTSSMRRQWHSLLLH